jgi:hypothetical protein
MRFPTAILSLLLIGLVSAGRAADATPETLATRMTGSFSNEEQARSDFTYHHVVLHIARIWPNRPDGPWLYVEQALGDAPSQPYRQQVYQLAAVADGAIEIRVFTLPDPVAMTAGWREPSRFAALAPTGLRPCAGCTLRLKPQPDGSMKGATEGRACPSEIHNAAYSTSDLTVTGHGIMLWDRGFSDIGTQIWGPPNSGFEFRRVE